MSRDPSPSSASRPSPSGAPGGSAASDARASTGPASPAAADARASAGADAPASDPSVRVARVVRSTPGELFDAWTRPDLLGRWFAPAPAVVGHAEVDLRVGGAWTVRMDAPDGTTYTAHGVYREVDPPRRLTFTFDWREEASRMDVDTTVTVTFRAVDGGTEVEVLHEGFPSAAQAEGHEQGWGACVEQLGAAVR